MDLIDKKIICELDMDCRQSLTKIAKKLRISRNVIDYRINNLEKEGIIEKYVCSVSLGMLGYKTYKIFLKIWNGSPQEEEFVKYIIENRQVTNLLKIEGGFDYSISIATKDISELDEFMMSMKNKFKEMIKDYQISIVVYSKIFKLNKLLLNEKEELLKMEKYSGEKERIQIDNKDVKILKCLSQQANISLVELAKKTKLSLDIVKYRMKLLNNSLVSSYRVLLNMNKLGYYNYIFKLQIRKATKLEEEKLLTWCFIKRNVLFCTKRIGHYDYSISMAIKDIDELNAIINEIKSEFGTMIDTYDAVLSSKVLKLDSVPLN
jgi:Lrp/AsnC family leucine-responsive transcriptional regulator